MGGGGGVVTSRGTHNDFIVPYCALLVIIGSNVIKNICANLYINEFLISFNRTESDISGQHTYLIANLAQCQNWNWL
jgi:hypothetical protein